MADAPAILSAHVIAELRKLEGRAKITYPYGTTTHPRVERVVKVQLSEWEIAFGTADEEETECLLLQQEKIGEDNHYAHVYRRYEKLPGPVLSSPMVNGRGELGVMTTQAVVPGSVVPAAGLGVESDSVETQSLVEAQHTRTTVTRETFTGRNRSSGVAFGAMLDVIRTRIAAGADAGLAAVSAAGVQEQEIEQLTTGEKEVTTIQLASGESQPTLIEWSRDNRVGFNVKIEKTKVDSSVVEALTSSGPSQTDNVLTEYVPFNSNKNFHIKIVSTFPTQSELNGLTRTYPITASCRFPDLLREAKIMVPYIFSTDGTVFDYDMALRLKVDQGHSGQFNGTLTEYYTYDPEATIAALPEADRQVTLFAPRADLLPVMFWTYGTSTADVGLRNFSIPSTLRDAQTITGVTYEYVGGNLTEVALTGNNSPSVAIEASSPTLAAFLAMQTIVIDIDVQPYVAGMFVVRVTKINNPHFGT